MALTEKIKRVAMAPTEPTPNLFFIFYLRLTSCIDFTTLGSSSGSDTSTLKRPGSSLIGTAFNGTIATTVDEGVAEIEVAHHVSYGD